MNEKQLEKNLGTIQANLDIEVNDEVLSQVQSKLSALSGVMGLSAECIRWAKHHALNKQRLLINKDGIMEMSATNMKLWLEGEMKTELTMLLYAERLNAAIVHCSDSLRTIISKYKEELRLTTYGGPAPDGRHLPGK